MVERQLIKEMFQKTSAFTHSFTVEGRVTLVTCSFSNGSFKADPYQDVNSYFLFTCIKKFYM